MIGPVDSSGGEQMQLELQLSEDTETNYSNLAVITHTASEVILDFAAILPGLPKPKIVSRVILTPDHAKRLLGALQQNIQRYEEQFGTIIPPGSKPPDDPDDNIF